MNDEMIFDDVALKEVSVVIAGKKYVLREANADAAVRYRNAVLRAIKFSDGKPQTMDGFVSTEPLLVASCMFELILKQGGEIGYNPVPISTILSWKHDVMKALFVKAVSISNLNVEEDKDTKEGLIEKMDKLKERMEALDKEDENSSKNLRLVTMAGSGLPNGSD